MHALAPLVAPTTELFGAEWLDVSSNSDRQVDHQPAGVGRQGLLELLAQYGKDVLRGTLRENAQRVYRI